MKNLVLNISFLLLSLVAHSQTKQLPFISANGDSSGYVSESNLVLSDALVWKVGGNTVSGASIFGTNSNHDVVFRTNNTERMRILANGNVGIGTSTPTMKLHVNGGILSENASGIFKGWLNGTSTGIGTEIGTSSGEGIIITYDRTNNVYRPLTIGGGGSTLRFSAPTGTANFSEGNVGIGVAFPNHKLQISGNIAISGNPNSARYFLIDENASGTTAFHLQAGAGSSGFGGSLSLYGHSHPTTAGSVIAGISSSSGGKFAVTNAALGVGSELFIVKQSGSVGIGVISPSEKLEVSGKTKTTNLQVTTGAANGYIGLSDASGNLSWSSSIADSRLSSNVVLKDDTNLFSGENTFTEYTEFANNTQFNSEVNMFDVLNGTTAAFSGTVSAANATAGGHLLNRTTGDGRYVMLGGQNGTLTFGSNDNNTVSIKQNNAFRLNLYANNTEIIAPYTHVLQSNTATQPLLQLFNSGVSTATVQNVFVHNSATTAMSSLANGDIVATPQFPALAQKVNGKRKDFAYGVNFKQIHNITFTDGADSSAITISDTTRTLRVKMGTTTAYCRVNMPQNPQNDVRITVLVQDPPTTLDFNIVGGVSGQSFVTSTAFTPVAGDVFELFFDSTTEGSVGGKWYVKKL